MRRINEFIKGADLSSLAEVEACGAKFSDDKGERDAMTILCDHGMNMLRLRLWNDPYSESGEPYGAGCNDFDRTVELARRRGIEVRVLPILPGA